MDRVASLPWYDFEEVRPETDRFWSALVAAFRGRGIPGVPEQIDRTSPFEEQWKSGRLLFSQACGYDVILAHRDRLKVVATPVYDADGCSGPNYSSVIVVREDSLPRCFEDLRGTRAVINSPTSHSGMNIFRSMVAPFHEDGRFFEEVLQTGSHEASIASLARNQADVAAIDCITWSLLARRRPGLLTHVRVLARTPRMPAPPFVTGSETADRDIEAMRDALTEILATKSFTETGLRGIEVLPSDAYAPLFDLERTAQRQGYGCIA